MRIFSTFLFALVLLYNGYCQAQCCSKDEQSTLTMAQLSHDPSFRKAHKTPKPFKYTHQIGRPIRYAVPGGDSAQAYLFPAENPTAKYVFVVHEWWGLNDYMRQESDRIYHSLGNQVNVIALDLFDGRSTTNRDTAAKLTQTKPERMSAIISGAIQYAGKKAEISFVGWCFGGAWALQGALLAGTQLKSVVMYYGTPEPDPEKLKTLNGELLGIFATKDKWIGPEVVNKFEQNLKAAGKKYTIKTYDADHAFANPSNPIYNKKYADEAYALTIEFLKRTLL